MESHPWVSALPPLLLILFYVAWGTAVWYRYKRTSAQPRSRILALFLEPASFGVALAVWGLPYLARSMFPEGVGYQFLCYAAWGLAVWYAVAGSRPTAKPGFFGRLLFSPICFWLSLFCWAVPSLLNGLFPQSPGMLRSVFADTPWSVAIIAAFVNLGPRFILQAEARYRNKFGAFYEKSPTLGAWHVEEVEPSWLGRLRDGQPHTA